MTGKQIRVITSMVHAGVHGTVAGLTFLTLLILHACNGELVRRLWAAA